MVQASGARVVVEPGRVRVAHGALAAALSGESERVIDLSGVASVEIKKPGPRLGGAVVLAGEGSSEEITVAPNEQAAAEEIADAVRAALRGEEPAAAQAVPGLDALAAAPGFADDDPGRLDRVALVPVESGRPGEPVEIDVPAGDPEGIHAALARLEEELGGGLLVAHDAQRLVAGIARAAAEAAGADDSGNEEPASPAFFFGCTRALARRVSPGLEDYRLGAVNGELAAADGEPSSAAERAAAVASVLAALARRGEASSPAAEVFFAAGLTLGMAAGAAALPVQRDREGAGINTQRELLSSGEAPSAAAIRRVNDALLNQAEDSERRRRGADGGGDAAGKKPRGGGKGGRGGGRAPWQGVATPKDPPKPNEDADESGALYGEHVTLTGDFEPFDKGRLWEGIAERGGVVGKNVTKKTTILVIGAWRSTTSKQKRAEELIDKGQDIALWPAKRLYSELGLDEEPPF